MRIIRFIDDAGHERLGHDHGDGTAVVLEGDLFGDLRRMKTTAPFNKLLAPIVPTDIICVGRNYRAPAPGMEATPDEPPRARSFSAGAIGEEGGGRSAHNDDHTLEVFLKPSTALANPNEPILIPRFDGLDANMDCEGELAVVIARNTREISEANALDCVLGYTIANDITARAFQTPTGPPLWMRGKGFDTFCPLGPAIITRDEVPDPQNLSIRTIINGQVVRDGHTSQMIRTVPQIIATLSRHMTLRQGAVILTGAPPAIKSTPALRAGDAVIAHVAGIGDLASTVA